MDFSIGFDDRENHSIFYMNTSTKKAVKVFLTLFIVLLFSVFSPSTLYSSYNEVIYNSAVTAEPPSIDPKDVRNLFSVMIGSQILEGLVKQDENMNIVPAVAESWSIGDNGKVITFKIRRGVRFHNGAEVIARDVAYSLSRIVKLSEEEENNLFFMSFDNIVGARDYKVGKARYVSGIIPKDDYTLEIHLIDPNPSFYKILAAVNCAIIPNGFAESQQDLKHFPISVGPFKVTEWASGKKIILSRHDGYYGAPPHIQRVVFNIMSEPEIIVAFNNGEIYDTFALSVYKDFPNNVTNSYVIEEKLPMLHFIAINQKVKPLDNIYFRKALQYGLDKNRLLKEVFSEESPSNSTIPYGIGGYSPDIQSYDYSPDKAREMLKLSRLSKEVLSKKLIVWGRTSLPQKEQFKQIIENNYAAIGLNIEVSFITSAEFLDRFYKHNMEIFYALHNIDLNDAIFVLSWYESNTKASFTGMSNREFDLLMKMAREEPDEYIKSRLYAKADQIIRDEATQINLYNKKLRCYVNNKIRDFKISRIGPFVEYKSVRMEQ